MLEMRHKTTKTRYRSRSLYIAICKTGNLGVSQESVVISIVAKASSFASSYLSRASLQPCGSQYRAHPSEE